MLTRSTSRSFNASKAASLDEYVPAFLGHRFNYRTHVELLPQGYVLARYVSSLPISSPTPCTFRAQLTGKLLFYLFPNRYNGTGAYVVGNLQRKSYTTVKPQDPTASLKHISVEYPHIVSLEGENSASLTVHNMVYETTVVIRLKMTPLYAMAGQKDVYLFTQTEVYSLPLDDTQKPSPKQIAMSAPLPVGFVEPIRSGKWILVVVRYRRPAIFLVCCPQMNHGPPC